MAQQRQPRRRTAPKKVAPRKPLGTPVDEVEDEPATVTTEAVESPAESEPGTESTAPVEDIDQPGDDQDEAAEENADASSNGDEIEASPFREYWYGYLEDCGVTPPEGYILFPGEPQTFKGNVLRGSVVEVSEDVHRMLIPYRSNRPTFQLVARAGTIIPKAQFVSIEEYRKATKDALADLQAEEG